MSRLHWLSNPQFRAIGYNLFGRMVSLLAPLLLIPAMLDHLGPTSFGIWVTGVSITALAAFMDFGIGNSLLTRLAVYFGEANEGAARRAIGASYRILGLILLGAMAIFGAALLATVLWPDAAANGGGEGSELIFIVLFFFILCLPLSVIHRILYAHQQILLFNVVLVAQSGLSVVVTLWAIGMGFPGWGVVSIYSAIPIIVLSFTSLWYFCATPRYRPRLADFASGEEARGLLKLGLAHLMLGILSAIGMNIDVALILYALDPEAVTDFAMPSRIGSLLLIAVVTAFMPLWTFNGAALARNEYQWVRRNTIRMSIGGALAIAAIGAVLTIGADTIMLLWTGRAFPNQTLVIGTIAVATVVIAMASPWSMVLNAAGRIRVQIWCWGAFLVLSLTGKLLLVPIHGAWIVSVVTAVCYFISVFLPVLVSALRFLAAGQETKTAAVNASDRGL